MSRTYQPSFDRQDPAQTTTTPATTTATQTGLSAQNTVGNQGVAANVGVNGATGGAVGAANTARTDITQLTPEYVEAHRKELGIPDGAPTSDFFMEFMAHRMAYQHMSRIPEELANPNTTPERREEILAQQQLMRSWGYNPNITEDQEVYDPKTGLYGFRMDPTEEGLAQGRNSIMSFRGSEAPMDTDPVAETNARNPWGFLQDWTSDFGTNPGHDQFYPNQDRIREVMSGGTDRVNTTGHSLGGFLAQRAASQNPDLVNDIVTFQAGGILDSEVADYNAANADGHMNARHHSTNWDVVHRAGEQHLPGQFFEHQGDGANMGHTNYLMYNDNSVQTIEEATGKPKTVVESTTDNIGEGQRRLVEGGRQLLGGAVRAKMAPFNAAWKTGVGLGDMVMNAGSGLAQTGSDLWGAAQGVGEMGSGLWNGAGQMLGGDFMGGLGTMGSGLWNGAGNTLGGLWNGAGSLLSTGAGVIGDTAGALWDGASSYVGDMWQAGKQGLYGAKNLALAGWEGAKWAGGKAMDAASWAGGKIADGASWLGDKAVQGAGLVADGASWVGNKAVEGASWVGDKAVQGAGMVADGAAWAGGKIADGASAAWEGTKAVGGAVADGASWVGNKAMEGASAVGGAISSGASKAWDAITSW